MARVELQRLGEEVRLERERQGLTQAELGARMKPKRHQVVVSGIESGENQLKIQLLDQVARALGISLGALLLRAGAIDLALPLEELLGSDPGLSPDSRDLMRRLYQRAVSFDRDEGLTAPTGPHSAPNGDGR